MLLESQTCSKYKAYYRKEGLIAVHAFPSVLKSFNDNDLRDNWNDKISVRGFVLFTHPLREHFT